MNRPKTLPNELGPLTRISTAPSPVVGTLLLRSSSSIEAEGSLRERTGSCSSLSLTTNRSLSTSMRSTLPDCACSITHESVTSREPVAGRKNITTTSTTAARISR